MISVLPYASEVVYKKGELIYVADILSRDCENKKESDREEIEVMMKDTVQNEMIHETLNDEDLQLVHKYARYGWPESKKKLPSKLRNYWTYRDEISYVGDMLFKGNRVMIPKSQKVRVLEFFHKGHLGNNKILSLARDFVFWRGMSNDIIEYLGRCSIIKVRKGQII